MNKKYFIRTFGCQMNQADSSYLTAFLDKAGYQKTERPEEADIIIFNTCSVREHAEERLFQNLQDTSHLKKKNPELIIGLVGCVPALHREKLFSSFPYLDFLAGPKSLAEVPSLIKRCKDGLDESSPYNSGCSGAISAFTSNRSLYTCKRKEKAISAFLPVITGCNNFCSYCVVPYARGAEESRPVNEVLAEAEILVGQGVKEIILLGQNVNSYQDPQNGVDFPNLMARAARIAGILRLGFLTSHPKDVSTRLFEVMAENKNIYKHLHLPLQSGSDKILSAMNRKYTAEHYRGMITEARRLIPNLSLTSDVIVGFPGETEADFQDTLTVVKEAQFDDLFAFKYSDRPGTSAEKIETKVSRELKEERLRGLWEVQNRISLEKNQVLAGKISEVLVLRKSSKRQGFLVGKTEQEKKVLIETTDSEPERENSDPERVALQSLCSRGLMPVRITRADRHLFYGVIVGGEE